MTESLTVNAVGEEWFPRVSSSSKKESGLMTVKKKSVSLALAATLASLAGVAADGVEWQLENDAAAVNFRGDRPRVAVENTMRNNSRGEKWV